MKLSEFHGEKALEVIADIIEPVTMIVNDSEVRKASTVTFAKAVSVALKKYTKDVLYVMAILDDADPKEYNPSLVQIPKQLMEMYNDEDLRSLFTSQGQETSSGSVTESTEETEET